MYQNKINYIKHFLDNNLDKSTTCSSNGSNTSDITPPTTPKQQNTNQTSILNISNITLSNLHNNPINLTHIKNINYKQLYDIQLCDIQLCELENPETQNYEKQFTKDNTEYIYNPNYNLLSINDIQPTNTTQTTNIPKSISSTIENNINTLFNICKSNLKSNVHPDTIKAIIVPYSPLGFKETGLGCASSYYQLYNRTKPIKKIILLCTNTTDTNQFISTSFKQIISYKSVSSSINSTLHFDTKIIEQLKPFIEINNDIIKNEISLINQLPFIETIAPNASIIPLLISNKIYLENKNIDKINNIIYILKKILKNDDTILICASNFTNTELNEELNKREKDMYTHCTIKNQDNKILQFIYDTINGIKSRSSKIDDILFIQNTPSHSIMTMYIFSLLLNIFSSIARIASSSSSSISSDDSGISVNSNKMNSILYPRITSYYTSIINKNIDLEHFLPSQLHNIINNNMSDTISDTIQNTISSISSIPSIPSISYIGVLFTTHPTIENNKSRVLENSFSDYEKIALIGFIKEQLYFNTNKTIAKYNTISKIINSPINSPVFKLHLGVFINLYKNNELRACIGTSETNNDEYTLENNIKRFIIELTTKETKCRDLLFQPITFDDINEKLNHFSMNVNILYHMKSINLTTFHSHQFNFGSDGLLFKYGVNDKHKCKYSLTSISKYFDKNMNKNNFLSELYKSIHSKEETINTLNTANTANTANTITNNTFKLFYNEGILINS
jgi:AmmeMemoRadiSam system protein B